MADVSTLAALVVTIVALLVATIQLTQRLMGTADVIRKCDLSVTGNFTKGGIRQWHWRQFRFTVRYQAILFALPAPLYSSLRVTPTLQIDSPLKGLQGHVEELRPKRTRKQACWVSFIQDIVNSSCLRPEDLCVREESGDRIPDNLTVGPTCMDAIAVMLACVALGMQVFKYSPMTGEIILAGGIGTVTSSLHPTLGVMIHYNVSLDEPTAGIEIARRHGRALRQEKGIWANTVFGNFVDRCYQPVFTKLKVLRDLKLPILRDQGWPEGSYKDTIGGAACFMAFGHVDVYEAVPPSCVRRWCAHFAEVIVKAHHLQIVKSTLRS